MNYKICTKCAKKLPATLTYFYKRSGDKLVATCKDCSKLLQSKWRNDNLEKVRAAERRYHHKNKEARNKRSREYRKEKYANSPEFRAKCKLKWESEYAGRRKDARSPEDWQEHLKKRRMYMYNMSSEQKQKIKLGLVQYRQKTNRKEVEREQVRTLHDNYIKMQLVRNTPLSRKDIPPELIIEKRKQLKLFRNVKQRCN
jgi:hypothetical protein